MKSEQGKKNKQKKQKQKQKQKNKNKNTRVSTRSVTLMVESTEALSVSGL